MKITVLTTSRSDYGATKWLLKKLTSDPYFETTLIATGNHYCTEFGNTYKVIESDGFTIDYAIPLDLSTDSALQKSFACSVLSEKTAEIFNAEKPDLLCVLGDRFELIPVCLTSILFGIPIAHISGGDITEGAMDDKIRHAVSKLSNLHFPGNETSKRVLEQMGEAPDTVFNVGELGVEGISESDPISREALALDLGLDPDKKWVLLTYHSETTLSQEDNVNTLENILNFLSKLQGYQVLATYPNADLGHTAIINKITKYSKNFSGIFSLIQNLGSNRFPSFLKETDFIIGNSSSAFFEAPSTLTPAINIGDRQKGRIKPDTVINSQRDPLSIENAYLYLQSKEFKQTLKDSSNPYNNGCASDQITKTLKQIDLSKLVVKPFLQHTIL